MNNTITVHTPSRGLRSISVNRNQDLYSAREVGRSLWQVYRGAEPIGEPCRPRLIEFLVSRDLRAASEA